jgi:hypothetical protein
MAASTPWVRRKAKSTRSAPPAAMRQRAALDATAVWKVTWFSRTVSTSWASAIGAVISNSGSPAKALLRCLESGHVEAARSILDQIAMASSSNATATRRFVGSPVANS